MDTLMGDELLKKVQYTRNVNRGFIEILKLVLTKIGEDFNTFSESLYKTRNALSLKNKFQTFVPCPKCHKLYEKSEVENFCQNKTSTIMKCHHVEFSNSSYCQLRLY